MEGGWLGDKESLEQQIHRVTGIPIKALRGCPLPDFTVGDRISWAKERRTQREEDMAYCLLGIVDVSISVIYGEGREKAHRRLIREIGRDRIDIEWELGRPTPKKRSDIEDMLMLLPRFVFSLLLFAMFLLFIGVGIVLLIGWSFYEMCSILRGKSADRTLIKG